MDNNFNDINANTIIQKMHKHMKGIAIFTIIIGVLYCLTIIGAIFGIPLIIMGLRLKDSANNFNYYIQSQNENFLKEALYNQSVYFKIQYIFLIIVLIIIILAIILQIFFLANFMDLINSNYDIAMINSFLEL